MRGASMADCDLLTCGGLCLCLTYTTFITVRFAMQVILGPTIDCVCALQWFVIPIAQANRAVLLTAPLKVAKGCIHQVPFRAVISLLLGACKLQFRSLGWRQQTLAVLPVLITAAWQALLLGHGIVSWTMLLPWWCSLRLALFIIAGLPAAAARQFVLQTCLLLSPLIFGLMSKPLLLPCWWPSLGWSWQGMPKVRVWRTYVALADLYRPPFLRALLSFTLHAGLLFRLNAGWLSSSSAPISSLAEDTKLLRLSRLAPRFVPDVRRGKVTSVYDGDTITVTALYPQDAHRFSVRLIGIDTPEMRGKSAGEMQAAVAARDALRSAALDELVTLSVRGTDKYGRLLATVAHDLHGDLGEMMLAHGHAVPYAGGARGEWVPK